MSGTIFKLENEESLFNSIVALHDNNVSHKYEIKYNFLKDITIFVGRAEYKFIIEKFIGYGTYDECVITGLELVTIHEEN